MTKKIAKIEKPKATKIATLAKIEKPKATKIATLAKTEPATLAKIEPKIEPTPVATSRDGYVTYQAVDTDGALFVTEQSRVRDYCSAVVADSPLGRIVARWSKDAKACARYARAINLQLKGGTPGMSAAVVVDVQIVTDVPQDAAMYSRTRESVYYGALGMNGPSFAKREAAKLAKAAFAAAQAADPTLQGPVQAE